MQVLFDWMAEIGVFVLCISVVFGVAFGAMAFFAFYPYTFFGTIGLFVFACILAALGRWAVNRK